MNDCLTVLEQVSQCQSGRERPKTDSRRRTVKETSKAGWASSNMVAKLLARSTDSAELTVWQPYVSGSMRRQ